MASAATVFIFATGNQRVSADTTAVEAPVVGTEIDNTSNENTDSTSGIDEDGNSYTSVTVPITFSDEGTDADPKAPSTRLSGIAYFYATCSKVSGGYKIKVTVKSTPFSNAKFVGFTGNANIKIGKKNYSASFAKTNAKGAKTLSKSFTIKAPHKKGTVHITGLAGGYNIVGKVGHMNTSFKLPS